MTGCFSGLARIPIGWNSAVLRINDASHYSVVAPKGSIVSIYSIVVEWEGLCSSGTGLLMARYTNIRQQKGSENISIYLLKADHQVEYTRRSETPSNTLKSSDGSRHPAMQPYTNILYTIPAKPATFLVLSPRKLTTGHHRSILFLESLAQAL